MTTHTPGHFARGGGVLAALLHELLKVETFTGYADLAEALKCRCARLKIPYDAGRIYETIAQVERGGQVPIIRRPSPRQLVERPAPPVILNRPEAARIYQTFMTRYQREQAVDSVREPITVAPDAFPDLVEVSSWR